MIPTMLVVPDPHAHCDFNNNRFSLLSKLIMDLKPDVILCLGDLADMPSLCSYEKGTGRFEGRRYQKDIAANKEANKLMFADLNKYNERMRKNGKKQYLPRTILLYGNHEERILRAVDQDPVLEGTIGLEDLGNEQYWNEIYPYKQVVEIEGISFCHLFTSGVMGRPIGGEHPAYSMLAKQHASCTAGHTHTIDYSIRSTARGSKIHGLVAGCFIDYHADFAGQANGLWWKGVIVKRNVQGGQYDAEFISLHSLKQKYS